MASESEVREKYGVMMEPIKADEAYGKKMQHFVDKGIDGWAWVLVNHKDNTVTQVNTYNGKTGKKFKPKPVKLTGDKDLAKRTKNYAEMSVSDCPVAVPRLGETVV